nr:MAG TPA: hypothetical protein [Caudoviricetes sp.]
MAAHDEPRPCRNVCGTVQVLHCRCSSSQRAKRGSEHRRRMMTAVGMSTANGAAMRCSIGCVQAGVQYSTHMASSHTAKISWCRMMRARAFIVLPLL